MANDIEIRVTGSNTSGPTFAAVNRSVGQAKRNATAAWKEFDVLAVAAETAAAEIDRLDAALDRLDAGDARAVAAALRDVRSEARSSLIPMAELVDASRKLAAVGVPAAKATAAAVDDIGDEAAQSARKVDGIGDALSGMSGRAGGARAKISEIGHEFSALGNSSVKDLGKQMAEGVSQFGTALTGGIRGIASLGPALAVGIAAAAPLIGAATSEAVLLGVGGAGIGAGIAAAFQNDQVKAAWTRLAEIGKTEFMELGQAFREPVIRALDDMGSRLQRLDLASVIAPLADAVEPLEQGLATMIENALPGVETAAKAAVEPLISLGDDLAGLGKDISSMFAGVARGSEGAQRAMSDIVDVTGLMLSQLGAVTGVLGEIYEWADKLGMTALFGALGGGGEETTGTLVALKDAAELDAEAMNRAAEATRLLAQDLDNLKQKADAAWGGQMGLDQATLQLSESMRQMSAAVGTSGTSLEAGTEKGNANRQTLLGLASDAYAVYQAELAAGVGIDAASKHLDSNLQSLINNAATAGYNRNEVYGLLSAYIALSRSPDINKYVNIYYRKIGHEGEPVSNSYADIPTGRIGGYSQGGPVVSGGGVRDDVLALLKRDEWVLNTEDVKAMGGRSGVASFLQGLHGGGTSSAAPSATSAPSAGGVVFAPVFNIQTLDPRAASTAVMDAIGEWERTNGKGWRS